MKAKIENVLNEIREKYFYMLVGRIPQNYEELLFQLDEKIREILKEE